MKKTIFTAGHAMLAFCSLAILFGSCRKIFSDHKLYHFDQQNLVANTAGYAAAHVDTTLINAWGIAFNPTGVPWVNSQGGHVSEIYDKEGLTLRPPVAVPGPEVKIPGNPTGIVFNGSDEFVLSNGKAARFIFVGVDGVVSAWNPDAAGWLSRWPAVRHPLIPVWRWLLLTVKIISMLQISGRAG